MPRVIITEKASLGLERCRLFLTGKNASAAIRAGNAINKHFTILETEPEVGRPLQELVNVRELVIPFGSSGYVALYHFDVNSDFVYLLAFRHQKEAGYETIDR